MLASSNCRGPSFLVSSDKIDTFANRCDGSAKVDRRVCAPSGTECLISGARDNTPH